jgi:putative redox protein
MICFRSRKPLPVKLAGDKIVGTSEIAFDGKGGTEMEMDILFPGGKKVLSKYKGFVVATDQPERDGGDGSAPEPYDLFLSSMGTCAGVNVLYFCDSRNISTDGVKMTLSFEKDDKTHLVKQIHIRLHLPDSFPEKYRKAVIRAAENCAVKRSLLVPPEVRITAEYI